MRQQPRPANPWNGLREQSPQSVAVAPAVAILDADDDLNKTERKFRDHLEFQKRGGLIRDYFVQRVTFKLGPDCHYKPDFMVIEVDSTITFVEVKGWLYDDAQAKWRIAKGMFPHFRFRMVGHKGGEWIERDGSRDRRANEKTP